MILAVPKETAIGERRVSIVPDAVPKLTGLSVIVESGAGDASGFPDSRYSEKGAAVETSALALYGKADIVAKVAPPSVVEAEMMKEGASLVSFLYPVANLPAVRSMSARKVTAFAMELIPRIPRAQPMDALSSQTNLSGYRSVVIAADLVPKVFPLLMTAAGTITPARVFIVGAGVAGLQAIATARRLGAVVEAYDVRPVVKEQVESLGAKFAQMPVEAKDAQDAGGYAKAQTEEFNRKQREYLAERARASNVVITTALIPGLRAPVLITEDAVRGMQPGSVVVDLAAEQGGNCALTEPGKTVVKYGVTIAGPLNLPSSMAPEASQLYSRNITSFLLALLKDGNLSIDPKDELVRGPLVINKGEVVHQATKAAMGATNA